MFKCEHEGCPEEGSIQVIDVQEIKSNTRWRQFIPKRPIRHYCGLHEKKSLAYYLDGTIE